MNSPSDGITKNEAWMESKKTDNDQELGQLDPMSCPLKQKGKKCMHQLTAFH